MELYNCISKGLKNINFMYLRVAFVSSFTGHVVVCFVGLSPLV